MMNEKKDKSPEADKPEVLKCEDIQSVLFAYMTRDLGEARSDLVHEHLRKCDKCRVAVAEMKDALELMGKASRDESELPGRLSEKHRARVLRAFMHPVIDWMYVHHRIVSFIVMIITLVLVTFIVCRSKIWKNEPLGPIIEVWIGKDKPPPWEIERRRAERRMRKDEHGKEGQESGGGRRAEGGVEQKRDGHRGATGLGNEATNLEPESGMQDAGDGEGPEEQGEVDEPGGGLKPEA